MTFTRTWALPNEMAMAPAFAYPWDAAGRRGALNRANGHLDWRAALPARPLSGPLVYKTAVLVACFENQVVGFDARSGRPLGVLRTKAPIRTAPILVGDQLYIVQRDRSVVAHALNLTPAAPPPVVDKTSKGRAQQPAPRP